jgi:hypothetical protein
MPSHELNEQEEVNIYDVWVMINHVDKKLDLMSARIDGIEIKFSGVEDQLNLVYSEVSDIYRKVA